MFTVKQLLIKKFSRFEEFACSKKTSSDLQLKAHKPISATEKDIFFCLLCHLNAFTGSLW